MNVRSLAAPAHFEGAGLFTAAPARLSVHPAQPGAGIRFTRLDAPHAGEMPALVAHVALPGTGPLAKLPSRNTVLLAPPACFVATIEHVMSALVGLGIADASVTIAGPEVPILDGSAVPFADAIMKVSVAATDRRRPIELREAVTVTDGKGGTITATPRATPGTRYEYQLDYTPVVRGFRQAAAWDSAWPDAPDRYLGQIAPARTFCLAQEAAALRAAGLFTHLTPRDMLVIGDDAKPVDNAFRMEDEPARHKLLDLIGDLGLLGRPLQADVVSVRGGHALTHALCRAVLALGGPAGA
jgi:UDP-3-O-[3-hydroxymyristoyl] N-acetylglucosamine deacetylase